MDEHENSVAVRVTNAPEPYDGFGTRTIEVLPLVPHKAAHHTDAWPSGRMRSTGRPSATSLDSIRSSMNRPFALWALTRPGGRWDLTIHIRADDSA